MIFAHGSASSRATHLFEEPGALEAVAGLAPEWLERHLTGGMPREE